MSKATNQPYHKWFSIHLLVLAKGTGIKSTGLLIPTVWRGLPYLLKKFVHDEHMNWEDLIKQIKGVNASKLRAEVENEIKTLSCIAPVAPETPCLKLAVSLAETRLRDSTPSMPT